MEGPQAVRLSPHGLSETNLLPLPTPFPFSMNIKAQTKFFYVFHEGVLADEGLCSPEFVIDWFESNCISDHFQYTRGNLFFHFLLNQDWYEGFQIAGHV